MIEKQETIINDIYNLDEVKRYISLKDYVNNNKRIKELINKINETENISEKVNLKKELFNIKEYKEYSHLDFEIRSLFININNIVKSVVLDNKCIK